MAVARRDALQRRDHELEPACGVEVVGVPVQPVDEAVTNGLETPTVAGQVLQPPNGAVAVVVTRELRCRIGQVLDRRHVTSAPVEPARAAKASNGAARLRPEQGTGPNPPRDAQPFDVTSVAWSANTQRALAP
jgi:hypothetical protein